MGGQFSFLVGSAEKTEECKCVAVIIKNSFSRNIGDEGVGGAGWVAWRESNI